MKKIIISLSGDGSFEISECLCGSFEFICVDFDHPNMGLSPWFMLWRYNYSGVRPTWMLKWTFVRMMAADEKHVRKVLSGIKTNTPLDEWLISE